MSRRHRFKGGLKTIRPIDRRSDTALVRRTTDDGKVLEFRKPFCVLGNVVLESQSPLTVGPNKWANFDDNIVRDQPRLERFSRGGHVLDVLPALKCRISAPEPHPNFVGGELPIDLCFDAVLEGLSSTTVAFGLAV